MAIEQWDIYNSQGEKTGRKIQRGRYALRAGEYHLVVHIWIVSEKGEFLIQRRSEHKKLMPGEWAATGGAAVSGEDSFTAARRELFEELGISTDETTLKKLFRIKRKNSLLDVWVTTCDLKTEDLVLQKSEVDRTKWVTKSELCDMISKGKYHNYGKEYFENVFEKIEDYRGVKI